MHHAAPYDGDEWPMTEEEYGLAHFAMLVVLLPIVLVLDAGARYLTKALAPATNPTATGGGERQRELTLLVWRRLQGELAVLACLPVLSWIANRCGILDTLAGYATLWPRIMPAHAEGSSSWLPSFSCHPRMPTNAASILYLATDVSFALLLTILLYFGFIALVLRTMCQWLDGYKRLEAGSPPRNPAEHFAMRQLDAMRAQLLGAICSEPRLQSKLEHAHDLKESVSRGSLYVSHFISEVGHAHLCALVDFTPTTWSIMGGCILFLGGALFFCADYRYLTLCFDVLWYASTVYLGYRLLLHAATLRQIERDRCRGSYERGTRLRTGWPYAFVDRMLFFVIGPGVNGFVPWGPPSQPIGTRCMQAAVLVQFYRIGAYLTDPVNAWPFWDLVFRELPKLLTMGLWGMWIVPGMLEVFSLPPFLDDPEYSLLLQTVRNYPNGLPADEMLVEPLEGAALPPVLGGFSPLAPRGGRLPRTPVSFPKGLSYVVQKGLDTEKAWWSGLHWRGMQQFWRSLSGKPPLADPARRLADHHEWIIRVGGEAEASPPAATGNGSYDATREPPMTPPPQGQRSGQGAAAAPREMI